MAQKKDDKKKDVKVQDLAPKKDAKGGRFSANASANQSANQSANRGSLNQANLSSNNSANRNLD